MSANKADIDHGATLWQHLCPVFQQFFSPSPLSLSLSLSLSLTRAADNGESGDRVRLESPSPELDLPPINQFAICCHYNVQPSTTTAAVVATFATAGSHLTKFSLHKCCLRKAPLMHTGCFIDIQCFTIYYFFIFFIVMRSTADILNCCKIKIF